MAIHCHSARYHYDSFHNRGGDIINIGSNNTYNIGGYGFGASIWGNGGNFWGGFGTSLGWGLGQGLMNWLGNGLNGGGWNPAGIFGGGMGYGMNPWQQMSTFSWGGSTGGGRSTSGTDSSGKTKEVVKDDPDCQKIADITGKIKDLKADATADDIKKIIKDIDDVVLDKNNEPAQKRTLENLKKQLQNRLASIENTTPVTASKPTTPTTPTGPATTPSKPQSTGSTPAQTTISEPWGGVTNWGDENTLKDETVNLTGTGYTSIGTNEVISKVDLAHDVRRNGKKDNVNAKECKLSESNHTETGKVNVPEYIALTDNDNKYTYNYKFIGYTKNNLPVYTTPKQGENKKGHIYVLVKKDNSYQLVQLNNSNFIGLGIPDNQNKK